MSRPLQVRVTRLNVMYTPPIGRHVGQGERANKFLVQRSHALLTTFLTRVDASPCFHDNFFVHTKLLDQTR